MTVTATDGKAVVLVVEDDAHSRSLMARILSSSGCEVSFAKSGAQALELASRVTFDFAILDLNLPDISGFEVHSRLVDILPECEVVYCSAHNDIERRNQAFRDGAIDFVEKPYDMEVTTRRLSGHIERIVLRRNLRNEKAKMDRMVQSLPDAVVTTDRRFTIETWNRAAEQIFGLEETAAIGSSLLHFVCPEDIRDFTNALSELEGSGDDIPYEFAGRPISFVGTRTDGRTINLEATMAGWRDEGDRAFTWIVRDVSERTALLQKLKISREKAEQASRAKSNFIANLSHEIRTPLTTINGVLELMRARGVAPDMEQRFSKIEVAGEYLLSIIDDVLELSKIESGSVGELHLDVVVLDELLEEVAGMVSQSAGAKGLVVHTERNCDRTRVVGDGARLRQCLLNYAANAVKFTERGSIELSIQQMESDDDMLLLRFEVSDTGIGIDESEVESLFLPFRQSSESYNRKYGGTGLGLAITRKLAKMMGGDAGGEANPDGGSVFWFTARVQVDRVPTETPCDESTRTDSESGTPRLTGRILVVEDQPDNREIFLEILEMMGLDADAAADGEEAVRLAEEHQYRLIIMDLQMPGIDGYEATARIREQGINTNTPIVAMTGNAFREEEQKCLESGMQGFIAKPVRRATLRAALDEHLGM